MPAEQTELLFVERARSPKRQQAVSVAELAFPEREADELAKLECYNKHLFRPNTYLHKWWARRSGTTFRYILKQLAPRAELRDYYQPGGLEGLTILDPMMGGGTTLHEAIRMGASVIGFDLDPIPVLQARASLTRQPLEAKRQVFDRFITALEGKLRPFFATTCPACRSEAEAQFFLYGLRRRCRCGERLMVDSFQVREETDGSELRLEDYYPGLRVERGGRSWDIFEKGHDKCRVCGEKAEDLTDVRFAARYEPLLAVGACVKHGQFFKAVEQPDLTAMKKAEAAALRLELPNDELLRVPDGPKSRDLLNKGVRQFGDLFSARQLLYLSAAQELLADVDEAHRVWLALLVSTSLEYHCMLAGYKGIAKCRAGAVRHVFSHHAYSFPYTALEGNPVFSGKASGTLRRLFDDRIVDASRWAAAPIERKKTERGWRKVAILGEVDGGKEVAAPEAVRDEERSFFVAQCDSTRMPLRDRLVDFVVTDPPYFDSVQYSDLSHFFRAWLRWFLPQETDWQFAALSSAVAETEGSAEKFRQVMTGIFRECNRVLRRPHGRLIFTYHHWRAEAWIQLTLALRSAGFHLVNAFTVFSENPISVHIRHLNALKHDCVLFFQPDGLARHGRWPRPKTPLDGDSEEFCRGCAAQLGWSLDSNQAEADVASDWRRILNKD